MGLLAGHYYTAAGEVAPAWLQLQQNLASARDQRDKQDIEKQMFPPCNVEWTQADGTRYWCTGKGPFILIDLNFLSWHGKSCVSK